MGIVTRHELRLARGDFREFLLEGLRDPGMQRAAWPPQQRAVGSILNERMVEQIARLRWRVLAEQQAGAHQPIQRAFQFSFRLTRHGIQQRMREFAADRGTDLRDFLR